MKLNWKVFLAFAGIFIAGAITGGFVGVPLAHRFWSKPPGGDQFWPQQMKKFTEQLNLTPEQRAKIWPILQKAADDVKPIRKEAFKATSDIMERMEADVAKELTEPQRARLAEIQAQERERRKQWINDRAKRGDHPPGSSGDEPPRAPSPDRPTPPPAATP